QQQQQQQQQQQNTYYRPESPSLSESDTSTDQNSETINPDDIKLRLSAWHSLAEPNAKERDDGIGGGQLHRRGKNYIPVDEATVLAIQQKGGYKKGKRGFEKPIPKRNIPNQVGKFPIKPPQKPATPPKQDVSHKLPVVTAPKTAPIKTATVAPNQRQNMQPTPPNRTQNQTQPALKKPSTPPSQSSQHQPSQDAPRDPSQPSRDPPRDPPQPIRNTPPPSRESPPPPRSRRPQQPQQPQQSQKQQPQHSWTSQLVTEPFWEMPATSSPPPSPPSTVQNQNQYPSSKQHVNEVISNQSQPSRYQSPSPSPRPTKPVQDYNLPYIPPEFDSTPYRNQPSPSPVSNRYNESVSNAWEDNKVYEQNNNNIEDQRSEYDEESDVESYDDRHKEPERNRPPRVDRYDRGQLLLTINVELSEGKTQAIEVHVNDDPLDLANDFCAMWKVTNPVVKPALECLIKEEKEKRLRD
ncbi:hypothetical protein C1645_776225, partial [Glomus cerebriforme]